MKKDFISVIVPIHNTKKYVEECLNSILNQSYKKLEILCIDSSTDGTSDIVKNMAAQDERILYVFDANGSYGYKINVAIEMSTGEYIAIVDSDDYLESNMYECLHDVICEKNVDFVKSDYSSFYVEKEKNVICEYNNGAAGDQYYDVVFNVKQKPNILYQNSVAIWTGLYRTSFIKKNKIVLNESPGASFQDTGFSVITHLRAKSMYYLKESFYRYRTDNAGSSVKSKSKNLIIAEEWKFIDKEIDKIDNITPEALLAARIKKVVAYQWNYERLDYEGSLEFAEYIHEELQKQYIEKGIYEKMPDYMQRRFDQMYNLEEMKKKVSIIVPVYNVEKYLADCLESLVNQDFHNLEIICVNDGSTDGSDKILKKFSESDPRVKVIFQENQGLSGARNTGISNANGDYMMFIDGDDMLEPNSISFLVHSAMETKAEIVSFDARILYMDKVEDSKKIDYYYQRPISYGVHEGKELFALLIENEHFCDSACLLFLDSKWLRRQELSFYRGILHEDCLFWVQCMIKAPLVMHINERFYIYRVRANSIMTRSLGAANVYGKMVCYEQFIDILKHEELTQRQEHALRRFANIVYWNFSDICKNMSFEEKKKMAQYPLNVFMKSLLDMLCFDWISFEDYMCLKEAVATAKKIEIYGAGIWGKRILTLCRLWGYGEKVSNFVITDGEETTDTLGIPVYSRSEKYTISKESLLIIGIRGTVGNVLYKDYSEKGYHNLFHITDTINSFVMEDLRTSMRELKL